MNMTRENLDTGLRFQHPAFFNSTTIATYKVCFCDADFFATGSDPCADYSNYKLDVGVVHATGVTCAVQEPSMQRPTSCKDQYDFNLTCLQDVKIKFNVLNYL